MFGKFIQGNGVRHTLMLMAMVAFLAAMLPTAVFAAPAGKTILVPNRDNYQRDNYQNERYNRNQGRNDRDYGYDYDYGDKDGYDDYDKDDKEDLYYYNYDKDPRYNRGQEKRDNYGKNYNNYCETSYKVRKGDTLSDIARQYRVSVYQLAKANNIKNPNRIITGQRLCIP